MSNPVFKTGSGRGAASAGHQVVDFAAGNDIFREGELGTEMFIVHAGKVEIVKKIDGEEKPLAVLERGDFFGEMSLLEELPRTATARAVSDVKLLQINGSTFDQMLRANPEIAVRMMRKLSRRLRQTDAMLDRKLSGAHEAAAAVAGIPMPEDRQGAEGPELLRHEKSGMEFHLSSGTETSIGRKDPVTGIYPDIDLTLVDVQRSVSRRHARILRRGSKLYATEDIGVMNGTFVNGQRLDSGLPTEVKSGDEVRVGLVDLRLVLKPADAD